MLISSQSGSQNHKKLDYLMPRRAQKALAMRTFWGWSRAKYPKQTSPTKTTQAGGPNREVLSQRSKTTHDKRVSCTNSGWGRTGVSSKNWFLRLFRYIHGDTPLDRTCIRQNEKATTSKTNSEHTRTGLVDWSDPPTQLLHSSKVYLFRRPLLFVLPRCCLTRISLHWHRGSTWNSKRPWGSRSLLEAILAILLIGNVEVPFVWQFYAMFLKVGATKSCE